jgi:hypothetical protein
VHSRYLRRLADAPVGGHPVALWLGVRRFFCGNAGCKAVTFAEQFEVRPSNCSANEDPGVLAGDAVMSDVHALVPASAEVRTCRVCGLADPPPDPTCRDGRDHRVGAAAGCPHCGRLPQACAWRPCFGSMHEAARTKARLVRLSRLARRLVSRPAAARAGQ